MKKISIIIMLFVAALASCKKTPEVNLKYVDVERDLVTVGTTTANIQCDYEYIATLKKAYFYYGEGENEDNYTAAEMRVVQKTLYVELTGLKENTAYSYYYEFHNGFNSMRTTLKSFKTENEPVIPPAIMLPTVITAEITEITANSAKGGGEVTNDGGAEVTERGICWSTDANPTLNDNHLSVGSGVGTFIVVIDSLEANTTYHVRAYAINEAGTAYGLDREFVTDGGGGSGVPEGAISGLFTINENGDQVYFSQGNLQYQASTNTWRFAENQWDFVGSQYPNMGNIGGTIEGSDNSLISSTYDGWIDLFGWGTSGWDNGNDYYRPWNSQVNGHSNEGYGYGPTNGLSYEYNLTDSYSNSDWGVYNLISNGGNQAGLWRTMMQEEWSYVFNTRYTISGIRYTKAQVNNVNGVILFPDNWSMSNSSLTNLNNPNSDYSGNLISFSQWSIMEETGAVFLPAAGFRWDHDPYWVGDQGCYWSVSCHGCECAGEESFNSSVLNFDIYTDRRTGLSVRLVHDVK